MKTPHDPALIQEDFDDGNARISAIRSYFPLFSMQSSFSALFFREKVTRTQKFLSDMEEILPWRLLLEPLRNWKRLTDPKVSQFSIVSSDSRRELFSRQIFRPTFIKSGLAELVSFFAYANIFDWHVRLIKEQKMV